MFNPSLATSIYYPYSDIFCASFRIISYQLYDFTT